MNKTRDQILQDKQGKLESTLKKWATRNRILKAGEQLVFELRIVKTKPIVIGHIVDETETTRKFPLPPDGLVSDGSREVWRLAEEDWDKLIKLPWDENQLSFITMLRAYENGPIDREKVIAQGIEFDKKGSFVRRFNTVLEMINDYHQNRISGAYYILKVPSHTPFGYYAIMKYENCREE